MNGIVLLFVAGVVRFRSLASITAFTVTFNLSW